MRGSEDGGLEAKPALQIKDMLPLQSFSLTSSDSAHPNVCHMSKLRRFFASGQICFVTTVTHSRQPILIENIDILKQAYRATRKARQFEILSWVVMPDHIHALMYSPDGNFSQIIARFKRRFALLYNARMGVTGKVWQHRFHDHIIRTEGEMYRCIDYMHINPVRKGFVDSAEQWQWSSIARKRIQIL